MRDAATPATHQLTVLDGTGDTALVYDPACPESLAEAQARFDQLMAGGRYRAFVQEQEGGPHVPTNTFTPGAPEHIFFTQPVGG